MNRYREDTKYIFSPPRYSPFWSRFIYLLNYVFFLKVRDKIADITVSDGWNSAYEKYKNGDSLLITPNHSDHSDPHVLLHLSWRYRIPIHFMAAREIFEQVYGLSGKILQRAGVFSIDREGTDLKSIKEAMRIIFEGKFPLVMFPEGEIYHLNERLTSLNQGAATIILRVAKKMKKEMKSKQAFIVPTAIKYTYLEDISSTFPQVLDRLEKQILWSPQENLSITERIYKFAEALLSIKEREYLEKTLEGSLAERLERFREILVHEAEKKYFSQTSQGSHPERIRKVRGKIRSIILADEKPGQAIIRECYQDLDRLYFAFQLYSYPGQYILEKPSPDRIAETLHKFEEDILNEYHIRGKRRAEVQFLEPINVMDYLGSYEKDSKKTLDELTRRMEDAIQKALEER
ncbi:MAG: 1-acyl-sn-glycerol-3-phosphate acyltransferase [Candidatus Aureabacteria bacterium]|nr:1-acyl-sn-glycerol-3-phosphate acyltransferase [Candidatus Auribacterota bacterium]